MTQHNQKRPRLIRTFHDLPDKSQGAPKQSTIFTRTLWSRGFTWEELLKSKRIQIISEAGTGKTHECKAEQAARWEAGEAAFYVELAQLGANNTITDLMSQEELDRYEGWLQSQSEVAIIFLDSVDELNLTRGSFETALKRLNRSLAGQLGRVKILVTARPIPVDDELIRKHLPIPEFGHEFDDESFADAMMGSQRKTNNKTSSETKVKEWRRVELLPLADSQIAEFADIQGIDDKSALLDDIRARNAEEFARRPQDLIELCADWRDHHRIRTHRAQVETNVSVKLNPRTDRVEKSQLDKDKAIDGASRLALAMLLTRKLNLRYNVESDMGEVGTALDPLKILTDWPAVDCQTLMERALFGFAGYGRVRFHNQSVNEYLAARQLNTLITEKGMPLKAVRRILFAQTAQGCKIVKPSMRPVAAWLALSQESIFYEIGEREPELLIAYGDPESLTTNQRIQVLREYFERYGNGGWRGHDFSRIQLKRFGSDDLADEILRLLNSKAENSEARQVLFELVSAVPIAGCADASFEVAMDSNSDVGERIYAIESLANLKDQRVSQIVDSMVESPENWPDRLFTNTIIRLFPSSIKLDPLRKLIENRPASNRNRDNVGHFFTASIQDKDCELSVDYLNELRTTLTHLVLAGVIPQKNWPHFFPKRKHLLEPLAAVCLRLLQSGQISDSLLESSIATLRLAENSNTNETPIADLRSFFLNLPTKSKKQAFWIADAFNQRFCFDEKPRFRMLEIVHQYELRIGEDDAGWVLEGLADPDRTIDQRTMLLEAAIFCTWNNQGNYSDYLNSLKTKVGDCEALRLRLEDRLRIRMVDPETERLKQEHETFRQKQIRDEKEAHASWMAFWQEVSNHPEIVFGEGQLENTTWDLWDAMQRSGQKGRESGWNRRFIEKYFNKETADRLRESLMNAWRKGKPTFRSERPLDEKDSCFSWWELGLAGIAAEAEDPDWAESLSKKEVELAVRYVLIEFNGLPAWLKSLAARHPDVVDDLLGRECISELDEKADANGHFFVLQKLRYADPEIASIFTPRLHVWFMQHNTRVRDGEIAHKVLSRLSDVTVLLVKYGNETIYEEIRSVSVRRLIDGVDRDYLGFWLSTLLRLDPPEGTVQFESILAESEDVGLAEQLFAQLFGHHREASGCHLGISAFSPSVLIRLIRLAYSHIRPSDDNVHDGPYRPDQRDNAERGRSGLLNALLAKEGPEAWAAKVEMANDPIFANFRDRALALALEKAAEEMDTEKLSDKDVISLYASLEAPPVTRQSMFRVLVDRLDDFDDILLRDDSPREAWGLIDDERVMRREIARQMRTTANGAYRVDQESVTADEKETDVRLRSTASLQQAVIELKVGNKDRSGRELRDTLKNQLVTKYMADDNCRAGCLLITVAKDRQWQHPDSSELLDPAGLEKMLREEASKIESEMGYGLSLTAKVLDLRPRLKTENAGARN